MKSLRAGNAGFSLIELMIAITILGVLLAYAVPEFRTWIQNARIRTTAESVNNGLQLARSEAVRRNANVQFVLGIDTNWVVGCETAVGDNNGDGVDDCPATIQSRVSGEGSTGIDMTVTPGDATTVVFNGFGRVQTGAGYDPITQIDVPATLATGLRQFRVVVGGGTVRMCDPTAGAGDPRRC